MLPGRCKRSLPGVTRANPTLAHEFSLIGSINGAGALPAVQLPVVRPLEPSAGQVAPMCVGIPVDKQRRPSVAFFPQQSAAVAVVVAPVSAAWVMLASEFDWALRWPLIKALHPV